MFSPYAKASPTSGMYRWRWTVLLCVLIRAALAVPSVMFPRGSKR